MQFDPEQLLLAINQGRDPDQEKIEELIACLSMHLTKPCLSADDTYSYLAVALKLQNPGYLDLVDSYLAQNDPLLSSLILESLCLEWNRGEEYLESICDLINGCEWDLEEDAQLSAIKVAGKLVRDKLEKNIEAKQILIVELFKLFDSNSSDPFVRQACYRALLNASGYETENIPNEFTRVDLSTNSTEVPWELLDNLRRFEFLKSDELQLLEAGQ